MRDSARLEGKQISTKPVDLANKNGVRACSHPAAYPLADLSQREISPLLFFSAPYMRHPRLARPIEGAVDLVTVPEDNKGGFGGRPIGNGRNRRVGDEVAEGRLVYQSDFLDLQLAQQLP